MTDELIIQGLKQNTGSSFKLLYQNFYPIVEKFIVQNNGTTDDAKDIFQETVMVLHNKIMAESLQLSSSLKNYIYAISRNLWLKELREKRKINTISVMDEYDESVEKKIINKETKQNILQKLGRAIFKMTEHCKTLLIDMFYKQKSITSIIEENGYKNIHTAQNQKYKCLEQARKEFKK